MKMTRIPLFFAAAAMAVVPHKFSAGSPASADSVNANFGYLDNAIKSKADTTALNAVRASIPSAVNLSDYAKTSAVSDTASKVRSLIPSVSGLATAKSLVDSATAIRSSIPSAVNLTDYAKSADVSKALAESTYVVRKAIPSAVNLSEYAKTSAVSDTAAKVRSLIPSVVDFSTSKALAESTSIVRKAIPSISGLATTTALTDGLAKKADLTAISDMATKTWASGAFAPVSVSTEIEKLKASKADVSALDAKADSARTIMFRTAGGSATLPSTANLSFARLNGWGTTITSELLGFWSGGDNGSIYFRKDPTTFGIALRMSNRGGTYDVFRNDGQNVIFDGNVSIAGSLVAKTTVVVPDYVFESDYKLASLPEIEAFTKVNKHLPEVPSAAEIEKGGMDLAQMNLTLLKKVEELTLHAIAQNKQLEAQAAQIQAQNQRLQALEANRN